MSKDGWFWIAIISAVVIGLGGGIAMTGSLTGRLGIPDIINLARNAGFLGNDLVTAVAIALAESSGNPMAHGDTNLGSGTGSFGLWQIYSDAHPEFGPDFTVLYDPQTNANAAYQVYSKAGYSFSPWSTFKNGAYLSYVTDVQSDIQSG